MRLPGKMDEKALLHRAKLLERDGNPDEAERMLHRAASAPHRTMAAVSAYAKLLRRRGQTTAAVEFLRQNREIVTQEPPLAVLFEKILAEGGHADEALRLLEEGHRAHPAAVELADRLASRYLRMREPARALRLLDGMERQGLLQGEARCRYAEALAEAGLADRALAVLGTPPQDWTAARSAARVYSSLARPGTAVDMLRRAAVEMPPPPIEGLIELAGYELDAGNADAAKAARQAVLAAIRQQAPDDARLWAKCGSLLHRAGEMDEAEAAFRRAAALSGGGDDALRSLIDFLFKAHRLAAVEDELGKAAPPPADWQVEALGKALRLQGRLQEAASVVSLRAAEPDADQSLIVEHGRLLGEMGEFAASMAEYERARDMAGHAEALWEERQWLSLVAGDLRQAWALALNRKRRQRLQLLQNATLWAPGEAIAPSPMVIAEQGIGDEIKFATCYGDLLRDAPGAVITCDPRLRALFERSLPGTRFMPVQRFSPEDAAGQAFLDRRRHISPGNGMPLDAAVAPLIDEQVWRELGTRRQCILAADLMGRYRTSKDAFASSRPLLRPAPELRRKWRERLAALGGGPRIGLSWRGMGRNPERLPLYASLEQWLPALRLPGAHLVCLQHGVSDDELRLAEDSDCPLRRWSDFDIQSDLDDLAALLGELDLVISAHNMTKELAGAVGARTWLVYHRSDPQLAWRRLPDGTDLWFSSIRHVVSNVPAAPEAAIAEVRRQLLAILS